jgi:hypothetical protein
MAIVDYGWGGSGPRLWQRGGQSCPPVRGPGVSSVARRAVLPAAPNGSHRPRWARLPTARQASSGCHWRLARQCDGQAYRALRGGQSCPPRRTEATVRGGYGDPPRGILQSGATGGLPASARARCIERCAAGSLARRAERKQPSAVGKTAHRAASFNRVPLAACPPVLGPRTSRRAERKQPSAVGKTAHRAAYFKRVPLAAGPPVRWPRTSRTRRTEATVRGGYGDPPRKAFPLPR